MPLRVKCGKCGRELVLDEVFNGAYCRCRHCRSLIQVPHSSQYAVKRPAVRIERPPLVSEARAATPPNAAPTAASTSFRAAVLSRLRSPPAIGVAFSCVAVCIVVVAWGVSGSTTTSPGGQAIAMAPPVAAEHVGVADDPLLALRTADPLETYFGVRLTGTTVGYVVDGDSTMAPYIDDVAFVTNAVNEAMDPGRHRFGVVMATGEQGHTILEVHEPSTDLIGARTVLTARLPSGKTDLSKAMKTTAGWFADTVFLVFAKPLEAEQLVVLMEDAEQTGAVTHVIALGEATKQQDLSGISSATGGRFIPVPDEALRDLVVRVQKAQHERLTQEPAP